MPCKGSSVFDFSICSTSGRHLVCRSLCQEGTGNSPCVELSAQIHHPPAPSPNPWHTFSPTVWDTATPPIRPPNRQPTLLQWNFSQLMSRFTFALTGLLQIKDRIEEVYEWLIHLDIWFIFPDVNLLLLSPNKLRRAFFWSELSWREVWWYWLHFRELFDWQLPRIWGSYPTRAPTQTSCQSPYRGIRYTVSPSSPYAPANTAWLKMGKW